MPLPRENDAEATCKCLVSIPGTFGWPERVRNEDAEATSKCLVSIPGTFGRTERVQKENTEATCKCFVSILGGLWSPVAGLRTTWTAQKCLECFVFTSKLRNGTVS